MGRKQTEETKEKMRKSWTPERKHKQQKVWLGRKHTEETIAKMQESSHKANLVGKRFGRLIVISMVGVKNNQTTWLCRCDCGGFVETRGASLVAGYTKSCGCLKRAGNPKHGFSRTAEYKMFMGAKHHAIKLGTPFNLSIEDILIPEECPVLGIPLVRGVGKQSDSSPSLDRLVPKLGYIRGNVCVISNKANRLNNNATLEELNAITNWVATQLNKKARAA